MNLQWYPTRHWMLNCSMRFSWAKSAPGQATPVLVMPSCWRLHAAAQMANSTKGPQISPCSHDRVNMHWQRPRRGKSPCHSRARRIAICCKFLLHRTVLAKHPICCARNSPNHPPAQRLRPCLHCPRCMGVPATRRWRRRWGKAPPWARLPTPPPAPLAWVSRGRLRLAAGDKSGALDAARRAQALDDANEGAARLALELMEENTPEAEPLVTQALAKQPVPELRMGYARVLLGLQRYPDAARQLEYVTKEKPDLVEA